MPKISNRATQVPLSPFRKLVPFADQAKARGTHVYHLNIGQPDILTPPAALKTLKETELDILAYTPAVGNLSYRTKLAAYYDKFGMNVSADELIITTGASEAIQLLIYACLDRGEEMIIPEPFYANYNGFAQIADAVIKPVPTYIEDGFALPSTRTFEEQITDRTKAIFITNPSNPTGSFFSKETLFELAELVKKHDLYLFVDEVYREFCYDDQEFYSCLRLAGLEDNVVVIDSVSKRYSACGARVGAVVTKNQEVLESLTRYAKLRLSPPGLAQILAEAMVEAGDEYLAEVKEEYDRRRMVVYHRLKAMDGVLNYKPGGAFYCFARFPVDSASRFCQWLLESFEHEGSTVMLSPGEGFYATPGRGSNEVRIAYVLNTNALEKAMDCLEVALQAYPGRTLAHQESFVGTQA
ncbi:MAG TPA: pyridoxal phosphate-dependent aminotransferase [Saprospiraceae bacterium]|nr:pyridoxal phosphate-dependent aminotransferase [Saprospiraceae bacterium]